MQTVTVGATFGEATGVVAAIEVAPFVAAEPMSRGERTIGIAATASAGVAASGNGTTGFAAVGIDFLPYLFESGTVVGLGGQVAYTVGAGSEWQAVLPRAWFAVRAATLAGAPLAIGGMLRCQFGPISADEESVGCGPALVVTRVAL